MGSKFKSFLSISISRKVMLGFLFIQCLTFTVAAADNEQEVFNQLYREIIASSPAEKSIKMDSVRPASTENLTDPKTSSSTTDPASEQLKKEIDKIVQDAKIRHSEAVKFMQDPNSR
jgi:hypothetical protein